MNKIFHNNIIEFDSDGSYIKSSDFVASPFRYPGGKFYALKYILPFINCVPHDEFREPFVGGGNIFFGKNKSQYNWLNDIDKDIIDVYNIIACNDNRHKLQKLISKEIATKERHAEIKNFSPESLLENAFKIYYLNRTSYSGIIHKPAWGYKEGKSSPPQNWGKFIENAGNKLHNVELTSLDFEYVINTPQKGKSVLIYLDPPYYHADQKRAYQKSFVENDHHRLANILKKTSFYFCLSYDDCPEIRDLYNWAQIYERSWLYNTSNCKNGTRKIGNELIITNYTVAIAEVKMW